MAAGREVAFAYRQFWCWHAAGAPAARDRRGDPGRARLRRAAAPLLRRFHRRRLERRALAGPASRRERRAGIDAEPAQLGLIRTARPSASRSSLTLATKTRVRCGSCSKPAGKPSARHGSIVGRPERPDRDRGPPAAGPAPRDAAREPARDAGAVAARAGRRRRSARPLAPEATPPWLARALRLRRRVAADRLRRLRDVPGRVGQPHHRPAVGPARAVHPQLLLDRARLHQRAPRLRRCSCAPPAAGRCRAALRARTAVRHAGLQRVDGAHLRGRSRRSANRSTPPGSASISTTSSCRIRPTPTPGSPRSAPSWRCASGSARTPHLLPAPAEEPSPQGRQHRRFRDPLGRRLRAHARARRRQPDDAATPSCASPPRWRRDPDAGIIQTLPLIINRNTLFARAQQFAARVYGPVIAAGLSAWMGRDGNYWGHNAIIRTQAFAAHCGLPDLRGQAAARRPHPQPRLRRGGADAPGRLDGLHAAGPRRHPTRRARPR